MSHTPSLKKNYIYNTIFVLINILFPLVTFPYISRTIGSAGIGKVDGALAFAGYFMSLGMIINPFFCSREIAKVKDDKVLLGKVFSEFFFISFALSIVGFALYLFSYFAFIQPIKNDTSLYLIIGLMLILNAFSIDWFFQGVENYPFITIRSIIFKLFSLVLIFLLIRNPSHYIIWAGIMVVALSGSNVLNLINSRKYVKLQIKGLNFFRHKTGISIFFLITIIVSLSYNMDKTVISLLLGDSPVAYYTTCIRIASAATALTTSLNGILLPRISYYLANARMDEFYQKLEKSWKFLLFLLLPLSTGIAFLSKDIILIFSGTGFVESILTLKIVSINILLSGIVVFSGNQILLGCGRDKRYLVSIIISILFQISFYFLLIPTLKHNGVAISMIIANLVLAAVQLFFIRDIFLKFALKKENLKYVLATIVMFFFLFGVQLLLNPANIFIHFALFSAVGIISYFLTMLVLKDNLFMEILKILRNFVSNKLMKKPV